MDHRPFPKIPTTLPDIGGAGPLWVATEKIHGAQLVVATDGEQVAFGKRKAWLGEDEPGRGRWYVKGAINDANGSITDESFFSDGAEFYSWGEIGWSPSRAEQYFTNVHLMAWHVDEREDKGIPSSHGIAIGANKTWNETWMAWLRLGWSDGAAPIYNETVGAGVGRLIRNWSDVFGLGVNWGQPPDDGLSDQWTAELFYRLQLSQNLQLTPSVQYLKDPALNPDHSSVWIASLRLRLNL